MYVYKRVRKKRVKNAYYIENFRERVGQRDKRDKREVTY